MFPLPLPPPRSHHKGVPHRSASSSADAVRFFQLPSARGSADSFQSEGDNQLHEMDDHILDEDHVTQITTFAGRQSISKSVGGLISRRLSRSRTQSRDMLGPSPVPTPIDIDLYTNVSVEVTVEAAGNSRASDDMRTTSSSVVFSPAALQRRRSRLSVSEKGSSAAGSWVSKAKDFTMKLRRRSSAAPLSQSVAATVSPQ